MKKCWKRWMMLVAISGSVSTTYSCGTLVAQSFRDAAIDGAAAAVEDWSNSLLDAWFGAGQDG